MQNSRLHFIGTWRNRYCNRFPSLSNGFTKSHSNVSASTQKTPIIHIDMDRSKWFGELPWEESLRDAHEFGKLVLFQNLDPAYSSAEVEDIVWNAFNETCRAKMVQQTALYFLLPCNVYSHR
ncbi:hypothetical protein ES319_D02G139200v1 [Gossypium barbadense]|uniref:Uncharacterized protein LOC107910156 n=3 Tax=Gossypium TaxID=3633 RepID=A0A1U8JT17_GOSHI|nr:protein ANTI-SILENCING 1-like [Gossypium hirsutum]XP_016693417.1 protein ANTI-SILENCING 1-like [Gossypium hirsutum]KAB2041306.1 hypothetical protein ES319_D02G139200v1 [Gossypium barbadense]TYH83776.1 hypothetical protein ES332_D02G154400v1 [Gossypium tomentosum]